MNFGLRHIEATSNNDRRAAAVVTRASRGTTRLLADTGQLSAPSHKHRHNEQCLGVRIRLPVKARAGREIQLHLRVLLRQAGTLTQGFAKGKTLLQTGLCQGMRCR